MDFLWTDGTTPPSSEPLQEDVHTEVCVIGGGMAAGPALAGALLQHFASADPLLAAAGVCALLSLILIVAASAAGKA